ncbi:hypothetical protein FW778_22855, partial [Ginsengibacter hankyongi]
MKEFYLSTLHTANLKTKGIAMMLGLCVFLLGIMPGRTNAQSISVTNVTTTPVCAGSNITITFTVINGAGVSNYFNGSTNYQVYLSDGSGNNFAATGGTFTVPGTYDATDGGKTSGLTATFTIPAGSTSSSGYKIAIGSAFPGVLVPSTGGSGASNAFTVNALMTPTVTANADASNTFCADQPITFSATPINAGTYQWQIDGLDYGSASTSNVISFPSGAIQNGHKVRVVLTSNEVCASPQTITSSYVTVTVYALPTVNAGGAIAAICQSGTSVALGGSFGGGATGAIWSDGGAGGTFANNGGSTPNTATYTASSTYSGTVTLTLTSTGSSCGTASASKPITVNPILVPSVTVTSTSNNICTNGSTTFTATPTNGGSPANYQWQLNGANVGTNSSTYMASGLSAGNYTVKVIMTSTAACAPPTPVSVTTSLTVYSGAPGGWSGNSNITVNPSSSICPPATVTLSAPSGASNVQYYKWTVPTGWTIISGDSTATVSVSIDASSPQGSITSSQLKVLAVNPCGSEEADPASGNNGIKVSSFLGVTTSPTTASVCKNGTLTLTGTLTGSATSGNWTASGGTISNQVTNNNIVTATFTPSITSGPASATITTNTGTGGKNGTCNTSASAIVSITVDPLPTATAGGMTTICSNGTATVSGATATNGTILWTTSNGGGTISNATTLTPTYNAVAADAGKAIVLTMTVTSNNSCGSSAKATATYTVNVDPLPTAAAGGSTTICSNGTATVSGATATNGTILWTTSNGGGTISNATTLTPTYNAVAADAGKA